MIVDGFKTFLNKDFKKEYKSNEKTAAKVALIEQKDRNQIDLKIISDFLKNVRFFNKAPEVISFKAAKRVEVKVF